MGGRELATDPTGRDGNLEWLEALAASTSLTSRLSSSGSSELASSLFVDEQLVSERQLATAVVLGVVAPALLLLNLREVLRD
ncbi:MAG TPA: hypothetical protein VES40_12100 [Ilumatobacteraceae bacterium]|nr:hypothetical protein [Ilumatobacteraceae bacterium]